jgi:hypothetical protein
MMKPSGFVCSECGFSERDVRAKMRERYAAIGAPTKRRIPALATCTPCGKIVCLKCAGKHMAHYEEAERDEMARMLDERLRKLGEVAQKLGAD